MPNVDEDQTVRLDARRESDAGMGEDVASDVSELPRNDVVPRLESEPLDRQIQQRLLAEITGEDQSPPTIGRFTILHRVGAGAMGTVYAAYDDQLDRKVALKLLHPARSGDADATHRMLREAQALAKLSHPNLVPVFEVGNVEEQVFLAMELVQGQTLQRWVHAQERPWQDVLQRWLEVSRALVAVHDAGLVHRDIKPANVLVGEDDRARLVDFGLARGHESLSSQPAEAHPSVTASTSSRLMEVITQSRAAVGTPAYMAPEVRWGSPAGPQADQYSLCVGLYESLFGRRPSLRTDDQPLAMPPDVNVPSALRGLLARGLSFDPRQRYPSMQALTEEMERILGYRRPRWVLGLSMVAAAAGLGGLATWAMVEPAAVVASAPPCAEVEDDLDGVWDDPRRMVLRQAIEATTLPYAPSLADTIDERLDGYASQWLDARRTACEATHVEHVQSPDLLDRRMVCLDEQRRQLAGVVEAGAAVDEVRAPRLPTLVASLEDPGDCMSDWLAVSPIPLPPPDQRDAVQALRATLAQLQTAAVLEGPKNNILPAEQALADAERLGYHPLVAEAALVLGRLYQMTEDPRARPMLERAINMAESIDLPSVKEKALQQLVRVAIDIEYNVEQARRALDRDMATITRLGEPPQAMAAAVELRSLLAAMEGDYDRAQDELRVAIGLWAELGDHVAPQQANAWRNLGDLLGAAGRPDEARQAFDRAGALTVGPMQDTDLPQLQRGRAELLQGTSALLAGRLDEAVTWLERAHAEGASAYGRDSVFIARVLMVQSDVALRRGQLDVAAEHSGRADAIIRRWLGEDHFLRVSPLSALGSFAFYRGRLDEAVDVFAEGLRLTQQALPPDALEVAMWRSNLGEALVAAERHAQAEPELIQALAIMRERLDADHRLLAFPAHGLAEIELHRGNLDTALDHGTIALRIREHNGDNPPELARTRWLVARIYGRRGAEDQARPLARQARDGFVRLGDDFATEVAKIDTWLVRH